jgi:hypothetical protein
MSDGIVSNFKFESVHVRVFMESLNGKIPSCAWLGIARVKVRCDERNNNIVL